MEKEKLLRKALRLNANFYLLLGLSLVIFCQGYSQLLKVDNLFGLIILGIPLIGLAIVQHHQSENKSLNIQYIILAVAGNLFVLFFLLYGSIAASQSLTAMGKLVVYILTLTELIFAVLQIGGMHYLFSEERKSRGRGRVTA